jgi:cytochrome c oxidase cbb3-type subunit II
MKGIRADQRLGLILGGAVLLTFVSLGATVALPAADPDVRAAATSRLSDAERSGMRVYASEGCWYCHTMNVRSTPSDAIFGSATEPNAYAGQNPALIGVERVGPDLSHVGSRYDSASEVIALLRDARAKGRDSSMPPYDYLSDGDLQALAAFLLAQR